ncbi:MAG: glycosyltransferase family 4 protein [Planctomycetes bacterium]|nr:glycosyltransferase family 4 protein [Planctomycetota bacterium]
MCAHNYPPAVGGAELLMEGVATRLSARGHRVEVISTNALSCEAYAFGASELLPAGTTVAGGVTVHRVPFRPGAPRWLNKLHYHAWTRRRLPFNDVIRTWWNGPVSKEYDSLARSAAAHADVILGCPLPTMNMLYAYRAAVKNGKPLVYHPSTHTLDDWGYHRRIQEKWMRAADAIIAHTEVERDFWTARRVDPRRIAILGAPLDTQSMNPVDKCEAKHALGIPADEPTVLFAGQEGAHKGIGTLLGAMPKVWRSEPRTNLVIAGARTMFSETVDEIVASLPAEQRARVYRLGRFEADLKQTLFSAGDLFVNLSMHESWGIVFTEAWLAGTPVVGARSGSTPCVIDDGVDGFLVEPGNSDELAGCIIDALAIRDDLPRLGANGRAKIVPALDYENIIPLWETIFDRAIRGEPVDDIDWRKPISEFRTQISN